MFCIHCYYAFLSPKEIGLDKMYYIYIDEAGRGPIAGPVYVGIVVEKIDKKISLEWLSQVAILSQKKKRGQKGDIVAPEVVQSLCATFPRNVGLLYEMCRDSKELLEEEREDIYDKIIQNIKDGVHKTFVAVASSSAKEIDKYGIVWALRQGVLRAMHECFVGGRYSLKSLLTWIVEQKHEVCLVVDGPTDFGLQEILGVTVVPVIDGDARIPMISGASIVAKVCRDRYMRNIKDNQGLYGFAKHKGYGTKAHYAAIQACGFHEEHRMSFLKKKV